MTHSTAGKSPEKDGRGRRVSDRMRERIRHTYLALGDEGKRGRELSASAIADWISTKYPDEAEGLPSAQAINYIVKPLRNPLIDTPLDKQWSLSLWMREAHGITQEDLAVLLKVQCAMAIDVEKRWSTGFKPNRLTVREARWVGPVYAILYASKHMRMHSDTMDPDIEHRVINHLIPLVQFYAHRERTIEVMDEPADSYDLDLELSFSNPLWSSEKVIFKSEQPLVLYQEMGLVPVFTGMSDDHWLILAANDWSTEDSHSLGLSQSDRKVRKILAVMLQKGIPVNVTFRTTDWDKAWLYSSPTLPISYSSYVSWVEYNIDLELMEPVWPLIKNADDILENDPRPIKVATAFWSKVRDTIIEMMNDAEIREKVESALRRT